MSNSRFASALTAIENIGQLYSRGKPSLSKSQDFSKILGFPAIFAQLSFRELTSRDSRESAQHRIGMLALVSHLTVVTNKSSIPIMQRHSHHKSLTYHFPQPTSLWGNTLQPYRLRPCFSHDITLTAADFAAGGLRWRCRRLVAAPALCAARCSSTSRPRDRATISHALA